MAAAARMSGTRLPRSSRLQCGVVGVLLLANAGGGAPGAGRGCRARQTGARRRGFGRRLAGRFLGDGFGNGLRRERLGPGTDDQDGHCADDRHSNWACYHVLRLHCGLVAGLDEPIPGTAGIGAECNIPSPSAAMGNRHPFINPCASAAWPGPSCRVGIAVPPPEADIGTKTPSSQGRTPASARPRHPPSGWRCRRERARGRQQGAGSCRCGYIRGAHFAAGYSRSIQAFDVNNPSATVRVTSRPRHTAVTGVRRRDGAAKIRAFRTSAKDCAARACCGHADCNCAPQHEPRSTSRVHHARLWVCLRPVPRTRHQPRADLHRRKRRRLLAFRPQAESAGQRRSRRPRLRPGRHQPRLLVPHAPAPVRHRAACVLLTPRSARHEQLCTFRGH